MHATTRAEAAPDVRFDLPGSSPPHGIVIQNTVLDDVRAAAVDGLFKLKSVGLEVGGVLFGQIRDGAVVVSRAARFDPVYAFGPSWRLSDADLERFRAVLTSTEVDGEAAVGFFVSHTRTEPVLSEYNLALFDALFPGEDRIALVVRPHVFLPMRCVVHYRLAVGGLATSVEFAYDDAEPEQRPEADETEVEEVSSAIPPAGRLEPAERRFSTGWMAACAAAVPVLIMLVALLWNHRSRVAEASLPPVARAPVAAPASTTPTRTPPADETRADSTSAPARPDEKRVKELQDELERLKSELARQNSAPQSPTNAVGKSAAPRFVPPPATDSTADRSAARLELEPPPTITTAPPTPKLPGSAVAAFSPPAVVSPASPGRLLWTGNLRKGALLFIENSRASAGSVIGSLPGRPARIVVEPASLTEGGMVVHTADRGRAGRSEPPSAENGWNPTAFAYDPKLAQELTVIEAPTAQNHWRKLVLRTNRPVSVVMISWH